VVRAFLSTNSRSRLDFVPTLTIDSSCMAMSLARFSSAGNGNRKKYVIGSMHCSCIASRRKSPLCYGNSLKSYPRLAGFMSIK
jgi:hypothetical protein